MEGNMTTMMEGLSTKKRSGAAINVYLLLKRNDKILLSLRKNTGYFDEHYGLISGHVEDGESASMAIIREAKEEAGLNIGHEQLIFVHAMHRKTDRFNVDVFFECKNWEGEPSNLEMDKCAELHFFPIKNLPINLIPYIGQALYAITYRVPYAEDGWYL